jgi:L-fucose isomerase-like protein
MGKCPENGDWMEQDGGGKMKQSFGVIVTTRGFFPSHLVRGAREKIINLLDDMGYGCVMVGEGDTQYGAVLTWQEAQTCAELFKQHANEISGILCILPNFGEELGVAEAIALANLDVPVLVQACEDDFDKLDMKNRRDAFCGKISLCNNLRQRGIRYSLTQTHTCAIDSEAFRRDIETFAGVCRVVKGIRGSRIAMLGARPVAFNTVRYSEKILQAHGISVQTVDFSEVIAAAKEDQDEQKIAAKEREILAYGRIPADIQREKITRQAKLCLAIEDFVEKYDCDASTVQCWDSVENNYGCATCLSMAMMGDAGKPSACESDVTGAVSMLAARLAAQSAPALMDWNNNLRDEPDCCICLHCSNFPKSFMQSEVEIGCLDVLGSTLGYERTFGACKGQVAPGPMTYVRFTTDDTAGVMRMYIGEGEFQSEALPTKGGLANCRVPGLQSLMKYICEHGFEHHVCFVRGHVADILAEAAKYLNVACYHHKG